ncbi:Ger(x)C family spore germination protein [Alkalihalobacillus sp. TS-13]|uniref:Ger(x)C family spore germination protein n=1 Tax=Alkalihalobacillus sp. TS-13 TaxID=2842455 RepID=UPI001C88B039|nr:Ger(x)C family spore germination protein [Alkalihalobacillus sp. TS-13]
MKRFISLITIFSLLLTGCTPDKEILDDINLVTLIGFERVDRQTQGTTVVPQYQPDGSINNDYFTAVGEFGKDIGQKLNLQTQRPLASGKIEIVLFGKEFAEGGVIETSDAFRRDPSVSANLKLAVYDGNAHDFIMEHRLPNQDLGMALTRLIEQNSKQETFPPTNIHLFFRAFFTEGKDSFLPLLGVKERNVYLKGISLFKKGKMVGELPASDLYLFTLLHNGFKNGSLVANVKELKGQVSLGHIDAEPKIEFKGDVDSPEVTYNINLKAVINEYSGDIKGIEKKVNLIEKSVNKELKNKAESLIKSLQEQNLDPLGVGKSASAHYRNWNEKEWNEIYPDLKVKVNFNTNILESGVMR